jgi:hypothetical protein
VAGEDVLAAMKMILFTGMVTTGTVDDSGDGDTNLF